MYISYPVRLDLRTQWMYAQRAKDIHTALLRTKLRLENIDASRSNSEASAETVVCFYFLDGEHGTRRTRWSVIFVSVAPESVE